MSWPTSGPLPNSVNIPNDLSERMVMRIAFRRFDPEEAKGSGRQLCRNEHDYLMRRWNHEIQRRGN
jgi:hypothetical protein